ncbi:phage integrase family protein [Cupriavidus sp. amp6]|uniref:phage integrase family protein n=1 Tax=Cupriavidus sp. amp6 TaxID=388051 RepID=UPI0003FFFD46|nr:phage integrase family protein [Cupriavidus sp. amp6]
MLPGSHSVSLTRSEFAAVRAYVQGMPAAMVVGRYLADDGDDDDAGESALRTLLSLRDRMVQLAHLHGRADLAELLVAGPGRSNRGMDRRVDALAELERLGTAAPRAEHGVELWFGPSLARRLRHAEIVNIKALIGLTNVRGTAWWRRVPRIGALAGQAINRWLAEHRELVRTPQGQPMLAAHVGNRTPLTRGALAPDMPRLLPLEFLASDAEAPPACPFASGVGMVRKWLHASTPPAGATHAAYRKEAERLLLWAAIERRKDLAALDEQDRQAYLAFLADPQPAARWCGPRAPRQVGSWRPFTGPLGEVSRRHSMRVLGALWAWMARNGYDSAARWLPIGGPARGAAADMGMAAAAGDAASGLDTGSAACREAVDDMALVRFTAWLENEGSRPDGVRYRAAAAAVALLLECRPRFAGLVALRWKDLRILHRVSGTRTEEAPDDDRLALTDTALAALRRHWQDRGLDLDAPAAADVPLLGPPAAPPTRRAQRKLASTAYPPYSVRGLHALLSAAITRYRRLDAAFPARSPRDLIREGQRCRTASASVEEVGTGGELP